MAGMDGRRRYGAIPMARSVEKEHMHNDHADGVLPIHALSSAVHVSSSPFPLQNLLHLTRSVYSFPPTLEHLLNFIGPSGILCQSNQRFPPLCHTPAATEPGPKYRI